MFFKGEVYLESKCEFMFDISNYLNEFINKAYNKNIKFQFTSAGQVNFSWNHENEWQVKIKVDFEVDDEDFGLNASPENAKRFIRDLLDVYLTNDKLTPAYIEDAIVETDDGEFIEVPDFYFISEEEFGDTQDDIPSRVAWENFKRTDDFMLFIDGAMGKAPRVWRQELQNLRKNNACAAPVKIKKRNMKYIEPETKANDKRKIFILDGDEVI